MPNGKSWTDEEWKTYTEPLKSLDAKLEEFVSANGYELLKNYHDTPCRLICWEGNSVRITVGIQLAKEEKPFSYNIYVIKSEDRTGDEVYGKKEYVAKEVTVPFDPIVIIELIKKACALAYTINGKDMAKIYPKS
jgi:hypothetical protein